MSRIHPAENKCTIRKAVHEDIDDCPSVLTVWKKSSMTFQGTDGFTVFNRDGRLAFRVDNYTRKNPRLTGGLLLMDGAGKALMTLKPQIWSMQQQWNGFKGEDGCSRKSPILFSMRRGSSISMLVQSNNIDEAKVFMGGRGPTADFRIEGSFRRRCCKIRGPTGEVAAEITRKKVNSSVLLSNDVFSLVVQPGFDSELIMAFVVVMDRICRKSFAPLLCS
ncbi:hypothetical protein HHK36_033373 [Tetracentron sinense]|uniref:Protein LURP-one-related 5-like n=1 Tax=Tetracentron sinense TaxID=13715 RepID=A0A835CW81_TETSI|nr:hypothetical protein HHK36_033373 [Tetracentron sinense]